MKPKANGTAQRVAKVNCMQEDGPNWILIAGGVLLSTLSVQIGRKLKGIFERKHNGVIEDNGNFSTARRPGACQLHSKTSERESCYPCISGSAGGGNAKQGPSNRCPKEADPHLPLVRITVSEANKENGVVWTSSPDRLEPPRKPFQYSNSSSSPCASESESDIYSKREVIHKLRQQIRGRDEMIMEMQAQITDLQGTIAIHMTRSANLQSQLDSVNRDLFESEREIQRLRKIIADHCVAKALAGEKSSMAMIWLSEAANWHPNGYPDSTEESELQYGGDSMQKCEEERVATLKMELGD